MKKLIVILFVLVLVVTGAWYFLLREEPPLALPQSIAEAHLPAVEIALDPEQITALSAALEGAPFEAEADAAPEGYRTPLLLTHAEGTTELELVIVDAVPRMQTAGEILVYNGNAYYRPDLQAVNDLFSALEHPHRRVPGASLEDGTLLPPASLTHRYLTVNGLYDEMVAPEGEVLVLSDWEGETLPGIALEQEPDTLMVEVSRDGEVIVPLGPSDGKNPGGEAITPLEPGSRYEITVATTYQTPYSEGEAAYRYVVEMAVPPVEIEVAGAETDPGEVVVLRVKNLPEGEDIICETSIPVEPTFYPDGQGTWTALLPVSYYVSPGEYYVELSAGGETERVPITVRDKQFERQDLTVDPATTEQTIASAAANEEYNRVFWPLQFIVDEERYWEGAFLRPVEGGRISTPFAVKRYTNGATTPSRHGAIDIALPEGTPIYAPNHGRVLFAGFLQLSGNSIMIEHGFGLKTWYFHMSALEVETGQMVTQGQKIGEVGTTGFSTGPHLHYGMSVREIMINPDTAELTDLLALEPAA